jgi:hypothetical protein
MSWLKKIFRSRDDKGAALPENAAGRYEESRGAGDHGSSAAFVDAQPPELHERSGSDQSVNPGEGTEHSYELTGPPGRAMRDLLKLTESDECCVFFDPEETDCFAYHLTCDEAVELTKFPVAEWVESLPIIKSMHMKNVSLGGARYGCTVIVSFTNLGERAAIRLYRDSLPKAELMRAERKEIIRRINTLKPPTSLTHHNIEHLLQLIESRADAASGDIYDLLLEERVFTERQIDDLRSAGSIKFMLDRPVPRKQIVEVLARWMGAEYVDVELAEVDGDLAKKIPEGTARSLNVLPFAKDGDRVRVAFWNPFDENTRFTVNEYLGDRIIPVMSCEEDIRYELEKIYAR